MLFGKELEQKQREREAAKQRSGHHVHNESHHEVFQHPNIEFSAQQTPNLDSRAKVSKTERFVAWFKKFDQTYVKPKLIYKYTTEEEFKKNLKQPDLIGGRPSNLGESQVELLP